MSKYGAELLAPAASGCVLSSLFWPSAIRPASPRRPTNAAVCHVHYDIQAGLAAPVFIFLWRPAWTSGLRVSTIWFVCSREISILPSLGLLHLTAQIETNYQHTISATDRHIGARPVSHSAGNLSTSVASPGSWGWMSLCSLFNWAFEETHVYLLPVAAIPERPGTKRWFKLDTEIQA